MMQFASMGRRVAREPAAQFAALGLALFGLQVLVQGHRGDGRTIRVTRSMLDAQGSMAAGEPGPSSSDLKERIERAIDDEVLYREALAEGLDREDPIVRRRLIQKMEFLSEDLSRIGAPTDADLESLRLSRKDLFMEPARISFSQVFLSREKRGAHLANDARSALQRLSALPKGAAQPSGAGDPILSGDRIVQETEERLAAAFGAEFAHAMFSLPAGSWQGPVSSAFGLHLVRVEDRKEAVLPELAAVRGRVLDVWLAQRRALSAQQAREALRAKYRIRIDPALTEPQASAQRSERR